MNRKAILALGGTFFIGSVALPKALANPRQSSVACNRIMGRVISTGDRRHKKGSQLCDTDIIEPQKNRRVTVRCTTGKIIYSASGPVSQFCDPSRTRITRKRRGKEEEPSSLNLRSSNPAGLLERPFGNTFLEKYPYLQWPAVEGAKNYLVSIQGHNLDWQQITERTSIQYPTASPVLVPGRIYKITVVAHDESDIISHVTGTYSILDPEIAAEILKKNEQLDMLELSTSELALKRDSIFMSYGLLEKTIQSLELAVKAGASREVRQLLAKRYNDAGFPELAEDLFGLNRSNVIANSPLE